MPVVPSPSRSAYNQAILDARRAWLEQETATVRDIQTAYSNAIFTLSRRLQRGEYGTGASAAWHQAILADLQNYRAFISQQTLDATKLGVVLAYNSGVDSSAFHESWLADATGQAGPIRQLYKSPAEV